MRGADPAPTDLLVIGGGVAGLTAAAAAAAHGLSVIVVERLTPGGQIATVERIRNFPGFAEVVAGFELGPLLQQQAESAGAMFTLDVVERVEHSAGGFTVIAAAARHNAKSVIVATGSTRKALGVPGESELHGRGVSHCASCDGPFFRDRIVVVAGGGDSAFDEAELLAEVAAEVLIVHAGSAPTAQKQSVERVARLHNVRCLGESRIAAIEGEAGVEAVIVEKGGRSLRQPCAAVFPQVGLTPNGAFLGALVERDARGGIIADAALQTLTRGLFVAGDLRSGCHAMLACVAGDGVAAALEAFRYLSAAATATR
ncbi:MAG TPA: FAD-dependent oxidoreductase [Allosphingosinicella sp.]|nr:FAD-dependent oxidoreductase [Allosphingosinicella sp.]